MPMDYENICWQRPYRTRLAKPMATSPALQTSRHSCYINSSIYMPELSYLNRSKRGHWALRTEIFEQMGRCDQEYPVISRNQGAGTNLVTTLGVIVKDGNGHFCCERPQGFHDFWISRRSCVIHDHAPWILLDPPAGVRLGAGNYQGWPLPNDQSSLLTKTMLIMMSSGRTPSLLVSSSAICR
jgi:hypothetical protein